MHLPVGECVCADVTEQRVRLVRQNDDALAVDIACLARRNNVA